MSSDNSKSQSYALPLVTLTSLFFMWGFITCMNDVLIPHLKNLFNLSYLQAMLVQFVFLVLILLALLFISQFHTLKVIL